MQVSRVHTVICEQNSNAIRIKYEAERFHRRIFLSGLTLSTSTYPKNVKLGRVKAKMKPIKMMTFLLKQYARQRFKI